MLKRITAIFYFSLIACALQAQEVLPRSQPDTIVAPTWGLKTNLLYDASTTLNLGVEFGWSRKLTLDFPISYNPWTFTNGKKWKHILVQPELRLWTKQRFSGSFFGLHAHYAFYNVGGLNNPPFSEYMNTHRFEGWLAGAGLSYGYRWNLSPRWGMEATIGVGYAYLSYDKYPCYTCGKKIDSETKNYFGPTKAGISLIYSIGRKKTKQRALATTSIVDPVKEPVAANVTYQPEFTISYIIPEVEAVKMRSEVYEACLDFAAGSLIIEPDFNNNGTVHKMIAAIKNDTNAIIRKITVAGYTSPEGCYTTNLNLSEKRAYALKDYVRAASGFPENMFTVSGKGEDWNGLDSLVWKSDMPEKNEILAIIRETDIFDRREKKLMDLSGGIPYRRMLAELFPQLRRSDFVLFYSVSPFTVEKGKEVFKTYPEKLSLNEMFMIAQTCEKGSDEYDEVFETAARIFSDSDVANINAAANAISRKDIQSAIRYLERVKNTNACCDNNKGIVYYMQGEYTKATTFFKRAVAGENPEAVANLLELQKHLQSNQ